MVLPVKQCLFPVGGALHQKWLVIVNAAIFKMFVSNSLVSKKYQVLTVQAFSLLIDLKLGD